MRGWAAVAATGVFALAGAALAQSDISPPRWMANIARHQQVMLQGVPKPYTAMRDRSPDTSEKLREGAFLFDHNCAACHGIGGHGGGPEAFALVPAPADLNWLAHSPSDKAQPYMYWSIAEGGQPVGSDMPAFKQHMEDKDIWAVIAYIRAGYPQSQ